MKDDNLFVFYVKNVKTGKPAIVKSFNSYEEAENYWEDISPLCLPVWGVHFHFDFENDDLGITKDVIFGKERADLR